jgi:hypothetical protein
MGRILPISSMASSSGSSIGFSSPPEPILISSNTTLSTNQVRGQIIYLSASSTIELPSASNCSTGSNVTVYCYGDILATIQANANDRIRIDGNETSDGGSVVNEGYSGDKITLHKDSNDGWTAIGSGGYWSVV